MSFGEEEEASAMENNLHAAFALEDDRVLPTNTPKVTINTTRLLFRGIPDIDEEAGACLSSEGWMERPHRRFPRSTNTEEETVEPLPESSEASSCASSSTDGPIHQRKRSSMERPTTQNRTPVLCHRKQGGGDTAASFSPKISPNSFRTMDGRFVHSKNPFSSPMLSADTPTLTQHYVESTTAAPPLPSSLSDDGSLSPSTNGDGGHRHHLLQPKPMQGTPISEATVRMQAVSIHHKPHHRFACSPIPEQSPARGRLPFPTMDDAETDDVPTAGSLHKVRRIHTSDDVFAASNHHLSRLRPHPPMVIDTACHPNTMMMEEEEGDGISPTDVLHFPAFTPRVPKSGPPPTPVKQPRPRGFLAPPKTPLRPPRTPLAEDEAHLTGLRNTSRFHADFDIIGELGQGSFGSVYKVRRCARVIYIYCVYMYILNIFRCIQWHWPTSYSPLRLWQVLSRLDGCMYAIKAAKRPAKGIADRDRMLKEVYALAALSDQADPANFHIVRYHQAWMEEERLYIQTELCSGTLCDSVHRDMLRNIPSRKYKLLREMLLALEFIHRHNMVHLDIKPENIFIKNDQYKLGDFGLVTASQGGDSGEVEEGDARYISRELLAGVKGTDLTKSDIFSLGISLYELCGADGPLPLNGPAWHALRSGRWAPLPGGDAELARLIGRMMQPAAEDRPAAAVLLQHPQLLSDERKAWQAERRQLAARWVPPKRSLTRANTWSGSSWPQLE